MSTRTFARILTRHATRRRFGTATVILLSLAAWATLGVSSRQAHAAEIHETIRAFVTGTFIEERDQAGQCTSLTDFDLGYRYVRRIRNGIVKTNTRTLAWTIVHSTCDGTVLWEDGDVSNRYVAFTPEKVNLTLTGAHGTYTYIFKPTHGMPVVHDEFLELNKGKWRKKHTQYTHWWTDGNTTLDTPQLPVLTGTGGYDAVAKSISGHLYPD